MPSVAKWRLLDEKEFAQIVAESRSFLELATKLGYSRTSGSI